MENKKNMTAFEIINDNVDEVFSADNVHYAYKVMGMNLMALKLHAIAAKQYMETRDILLNFIEKKNGEEHEDIRVKETACRKVRNFNIDG